MKNGVALLALLTLAGCANNTNGIRAADLRSDAYFRTERVLPMTFPQIQMALFKHEAACGSAPKFALEPGQTALARLSDEPLGSTDRREIIVADLMHFRSSDVGGWMAPDEDRNYRTRAKVYSYYAGSEIDTRIEQLFRAITHPQACPGDPIEPDGSDESTSAQD
ncbi:hypothetical protein [Pollutimonas harenae]|uniref:Uncharacterized protein n=1 Tax=Pollutimonas harenae TaxID=657015 RepID=A0A853H831_9BURK|nr:hypothetical protein [Pollutimonas harenae]NYT86643.1 hypothetical protein [Pollutimonas harenae]TEA69619.1 hypothetical protein ERD84_12790 [Pollutimonas harenae]